MSNILELKRKPTAYTAEPVVNKMPKTIRGPYLANTGDEFVVPEKYVGWLDDIQFRGGCIAKQFSYEDEGELVAITLNNVCRAGARGISWRMSRRQVVLDILSKFKGHSYIEYHPGFTGVSILVNGYAHKAGRGLDNLRWIEVLDYTYDKPLPLTGFQLPEWSIDEPLEFQDGLDWLHEFAMEEHDELPNNNDVEVESMLDQLVAERNRLILDLENATESAPLLNDAQYYAVIQSLLEHLLDEDSLIPYRLLDGFLPEE